MAIPLRPDAVWGQAADAAHRPHPELPGLAENPSAVPARVSVERPMDPDDFIRSIDLTLEGDPVPHKVTFGFSPASGGASVAFPMRSGLGRLLRAHGEATRALNPAVSSAATRPRGLTA